MKNNHEEDTHGLVSTIYFAVAIIMVLVWTVAVSLGWVDWIINLLK